MYVLRCNGRACVLCDAAVFVFFCSDEIVAVMVITTDGGRGRDAVSACVFWRPLRL